MRRCMGKTSRCQRPHQLWRDFRKKNLSCPPLLQKSLPTTKNRILLWKTDFYVLKDKKERKKGWRILKTKMMMVFCWEFPLASFLAGGQIMTTEINSCENNLGEQGFYGPEDKSLITARHHALYFKNLSNDARCRRSGFILWKMLILNFIFTYPRIILSPSFQKSDSVLDEVKFYKISVQLLVIGKIFCKRWFSQRHGKLFGLNRYTKRHQLWIKNL